jgi:hypothetical protein
MKHFNFKAKHPLSVIYGLGLGESRPFLVLFHSLVHRRRLFLPGVRLLALRLLAQVVYAFCLLAALGRLPIVLQLPRPDLGLEGVVPGLHLSRAHTRTLLMNLEHIICRREAARLVVLGGAVVPLEHHRYVGVVDLQRGQVLQSGERVYISSMGSSVQNLSCTV